MQADQERRQRQLRFRFRRLRVLGCLLLVAVLAGCPGGGEAPPAPAEGPSREARESSAAAPVAAAEPAAGPVVSPPLDSSTARAILDAVRPPVEEELGQPVGLEVTSLRTDGVWAYLDAKPRTPGGEPLDYSATGYAAEIEEGFFDDWLCALLRRQGEGWQVVALDIGATDAPFVDWPGRFGAPTAVVLPTSAE